MCQPKKKRLHLLTHNVWAHYFSTPTKQPDEGAAYPVMQGVLYEDRLRALANGVAKHAYDGDGL